MFQDTLSTQKDTYDYHLYMSGST